MNILKPKTNNPPKESLSQTILPNQNKAKPAPPPPPMPLMSAPPLPPPLLPPSSSTSTSILKANPTVKAKPAVNPSRNDLLDSIKSFNSKKGLKKVSAEPEQKNLAKISSHKPTSLGSRQTITDQLNSVLSNYKIN